MTTETILYNALGVMELGGIIMLLYCGTFIETKFFTYCKGLMALVVVGLLFRIMHWPYATIMLFMGCIGILLLYAWSFFMKPNKIRLDYLKMIWLLTAVVGYLLKLLHFIDSDYRIVTEIIMFFALLDFFRNRLVQQNNN